MSVEIRVSGWPEMKSFVDTWGKSSLKYIELSDKYELVAIDGDGSFNVTFTMSKNPTAVSDLSDFLGNYKPHANVKFWNRAFSPDGRLRVDSRSNPGEATSVGVIDPQEWASYISTSAVSYPDGSWRTIWSDTGCKGLLFGFHINGDSDKLMCRLTIDSKLLFTIDVKTLKDTKFKSGEGTLFQNRQVFCATDYGLDFSPCWPIIVRNSISIEAKKEDDKDFDIENLFVFRTKEV